MKKVFLSMGLALAAITLTNCAKEAEGVKPAGKRLTIDASIEPTRATIDDAFKVSWAQADSIGVHIETVDGTVVANNIKFNYDASDGKFHSATGVALAPATDYVWYAYFPYTSNGAQTKTRTAFNDSNKNLSNKQVQAADAPKAHLPRFDFMAGSATINSDNPVSLSLKHKFALMHLTIRNTSSTAFTPKTVTFSADNGNASSPVKLASGAIYYDFTTNTISFSSTTYQTIDLGLTGASEVAVNGTFDAYFMVAPFSIDAGTINVKVVPTAGNAVVASKEIAAALSFAGGAIHRTEIPVVDDVVDDWTGWVQEDFSDAAVQCPKNGTNPTYGVFTFTGSSGIVWSVGGGMAGSQDKDKFTGSAQPVCLGKKADNANANCTLTSGTIAGGISKLYFEYFGNGKSFKYTVTAGGTEVASGTLTASSTLKESGKIDIPNATSDVVIKFENTSGARRASIGNVKWLPVQ